MAFIGSHNRFNEFRDDFLKDTGFQNVEDNMDLYIQYVIARFADQNHRLLTDLRIGIQDLYKVLRKVQGFNRFDFLLHLNPRSRNSTRHHQTYFNYLYALENCAEMEKVIRYVRVNSRTWVGTRLNIPEEQVISKFHENLKLSPYFNPKKFFTIK